MSKVPQTDDLPRATVGYDAARVDEAFAAFADRVRELETVAAELRSELRSLRADRARPVRPDDEVWPSDDVAAYASPDWVAAVPAPLQHGLRVPRLALEGAFLLLAGLFAGLADLSTAWIVLVMTVAWSLVALAEWAAATKRSRWRLDEIAPPLGTPGAAETTGPWDMPVVESTAIEEGPDPESQTIVTTLPAEPEPVEPDAVEPEPVAAPPRRRRVLRRRKQPAEAGAADPREA